MADWQEWVTSCIMSIIFAYMLARLISVVHSFHTGKLRIERERNESPQSLEILEDRAAENLDSLHCVHRHAVKEPVDMDDMPLDIHNNERTHETFERSQTHNGLVENTHLPNVASHSQDLHREKVEEESLLSDDEDWEGIDGSDLDKAFGKAASYLEKVVLDASNKLSNEMKLQFYGLYKQATEGPCSSPQPPAYRLSARAKWNAWKTVGDLSPEEGMQRYITLLSEMCPSWNQDSRDEDLAGSSQDLPTGNERQAPRMGPVFSMMLNDPMEQEGLDGIHKCAKAGDLTGLERLLQSNAAVDQKDGDGRTALHWAADQGHLEVVKLLICRGAEINAKDSDGQTALHYATTCEWEEIAAFLLEKGADPSLVDNDGCTPYEHSLSAW